MIKVNFNEATTSRAGELVVYDDINRIPFEYKIATERTTSEAISVENYWNKNMVQLRFDKYNFKLFEVTLISYNPMNVISEESIFNDSTDIVYDCSIDQVATRVISFSEHVEIARTGNAVRISFGSSSVIKYYRVSVNLSFGINQNKELCSIVLESLNSKSIKTIFSY